MKKIWNIVTYLSLELKRHPFDNNHPWRSKFIILTYGENDPSYRNQKETGLAITEWKTTIGPEEKTQWKKSDIIIENFDHVHYQIFVW